MKKLYICPNDFRAYELVHNNKNSHFLFEDMINNQITYFFNQEKITYNLNKFFFIQKDLRFLLSSLFILKKIVRKYSIDYIIINNFYLSFIMILINRLQKKICINILPSDYETKFSKNVIKNIILNKIFLHNLKYSSKILIDNDFIFKYISGYNIKNLNKKIIYFSHPFLKKKLNIKKKRYIVFFGNINNYNNIDLLLLSLKKINKLFNLRLLIVGDEEKFNRYYKNLDEPTKNLIDFTGFISNEILPEYISSCMIGINFASSVRNNHSLTCTSRLSLYLNCNIPFIFSKSLISYVLNQKYRVSELVNEKNIINKVNKILKNYKKYQSEILRFSNNYHLNKIPLNVLLSDE